MKKNLESQYNHYLQTAATQLSDVYGRWSQAKQNGYDYCVRDMNRLNGERFRILSANTFQFTCGFTYTDPDTGALMFRVHTANNVYDWAVK